MVDIKDLAGIEKPAIKLLEIISNTTGVLYEPTRIRRKAKAEADVLIIKEKANIEITEIQQRGLIRLIIEEGQKQENLEKIIDEAILALDDDAAPEHIDRDWLLTFIDKAKNISSEQLQSLWSSILSRESNKTGSISKRTLGLLSTIDKKDADMFTVICQFTIEVSDIHPIIYNFDDEIYKEYGITFNVLSHLDDIGLLRFEHIGEFAATDLKKNAKAYYFGKEIPNAINYEINEIATGRAAFTNIGKELFAISGVVFQESIYHYLCNQSMSKRQ